MGATQNEDDDDDDTWLTIKMRCITKLVENNKKRERERGSPCVVLYVTKSRFHFINIEMGENNDELSTCQCGPFTP
jgi:hypothetical protein